MGLIKTNQILKNYIINGNFDIWQRGDSGTADYVADRFKVIAASSTTKSTDVPGNGQSKYSMDLAQTAVTHGYFQYRMESADSIKLNGKTVTLSFWAKSIVGTGTLYVEGGYANAVDNFSGYTGVLTTIFLGVPSTSWTRYTLTFLVTSTMATNGIWLQIVRNNSSANQTRYSQIMLNEGTVAAPFQTAGANIEEELTMCQRYYQRNPRLWAEQVNATEYYIIWQFLTTLRAPPTISLLTTTPYSERVPHAAAATGVGSTISSLHSANDHSSAFKINGFSGLIAYDFGFFDASQLAASAEL